MHPAAEEIFKRINAHKGIAGTLIIDAGGIPIHTTLDNASTIHYAQLMSILITKARNAVRELNPEDDLEFLRIKTKKNEVQVAPAKDGSALIVVQIPLPCPS